MPTLKNPRHSDSDGLALAKRAETRELKPVAEPSISNDGKMSKPWLFQPGWKGGPGRPKGSRNKLGEKYFEDYYAEWLEHGREAITAMRKANPADFVKIAAQIIPKELHVITARLEELNDDVLFEVIDAIRSDDQKAIADSSAADAQDAPGCLVKTHGQA